MATHTYGDDTLRLKDVEDKKLTLDWSELIAGIHCAAWSAFTVKDRHNSADRQRLLRLQGLQWLWWPQSTSFMDNRRSPTIWMIFDCNYINDKAAIDKSSANDPLTLSKQKLLAAQALMVTLDENVKSISMRHWNTGFSKHSSRSPNTRQKWRDATRTGSYQLRRNQHLYDTEAFKWLGISHQAALITTLAMTGGVMQHAKDTGRCGSQSSTWTISHWYTNQTC